MWRALSEVPGWPDAPLALRLRRLVPMFVPCAAMLLFAGWRFGIRDPQAWAERMASSHLFEQEDAVAKLRLTCSDQQATTIATRAARMEALLLASSEEVAVFWRQLRDEIRALGWDASFQTYEAPPAETRMQVGFVSARARLEPLAGNPAPFASLLTVLEHLSGADRRIDLTRLGVHADEPGQPTVELNLRVACRLSDEKTSE